MKNNTQTQPLWKPVLQAIPHIFNYQIITKAALAVWIILLGKIFQALLKSSGRVAVTSGDYKFLFTTWQGIAILLLGLVTLFIYVTIDLNSKIALSRNLLNGEKASPGTCIKEGFLSIGRLINLRGIIVVIYIALIAPVLGIGVSVTLTEGLHIPTFITAFIESSVLYSALAGAAVLLFLSVGIANLFILHGIVLDGMTVAEAGKQSGDLIRANWKDYLKQNILFILLIVVLLAGVLLVFLALPLKLIGMLPLSGPVSRLLTVFFVTGGVLISVLADLLGTPLYLLKMTQLYYSYRQGTDFEWHGREPENHTAGKVVMILAVAAVFAAVFLMNANFDRLFPAGSDVKIIAHRGGGSEAAENTLAGLEAACRTGAYGSEIDIQRTADGHYIINHDGTFKRVAGEKRKPQEMTLQEIRKLSVDGEPVPAFEEMLEAGQGRIVLFTELKGKTADRKMAEDAVHLVRQYHMEEECVLIALDYGLIDYIETTYPEMQTGFLTFASFGKTADLNCDYIGLEEESATKDAIRSIHQEGKKVLVWTVNKKGSQKYFLCTRADAIITDYVSRAAAIASELEERSDLERMIDTIKTVI